MKKEIYKGYKDKEKRKKYLSRYNKKWYKKNKEKIRKYMREYVKEKRKKESKENREKRLSYQKEYNKQHNPPTKKVNEMVGQCKMGRTYELEALKLLNGSTDTNKISFKNHHDIFWQDKKIDVKSREVRKGNWWSFSTNKLCDADYYLCFCLKGKKIIKILLIPKEKYNNGIAIGIKSNWDKYNILTTEIN